MTWEIIQKNLDRNEAAIFARAIREREVNYDVRVVPSGNKFSVEWVKARFN